MVDNGDISEYNILMKNNARPSGGPGPKPTKLSDRSLRTRKLISGRMGNLRPNPMMQPPHQGPRTPFGMGIDRESISNRMHPTAHIRPPPHSSHPGPHGLMPPPRNPPPHMPSRFPTNIGTNNYPPNLNTTQQQQRYPQQPVNRPPQPPLGPAPPRPSFMGDSQSRVTQNREVDKLFDDFLNSDSTFGPAPTDKKPRSRSSSSESSKATSRRHRHSSRAQRKKHDLYGISDDDDDMSSVSSVSSFSRSSRKSSKSNKSRSSTRRSTTSRISSRKYKHLDSNQVREIEKTIKTYVPKDFRDVVRNDIIERLKELKSHGYTTPAGFDETKHSLEMNQYQLFSQQLRQQKDADKVKMKHVLNMVATSVDWICSALQISFIKTQKLPFLVSEAFEDNEFDDALENVGEYLRGTVFDHPIFSIALKLMSLVGKAHHDQVLEENHERQQQHKTELSRREEVLKRMRELRQNQTNQPVQQQQQSQGSQQPQMENQGQQHPSDQKSTSVKQSNDDKLCTKRPFASLPTPAELIDSDMAQPFDHEIGRGDIPQNVGNIIGNLQKPLEHAMALTQSQPAPKQVPTAKVSLM